MHMMEQYINFLERRGWSVTFANNNSVAICIRNVENGIHHLRIQRNAGIDSYWLKMRKGAICILPEVTQILSTHEQSTEFYSKHDREWPGSEFFRLR